MLDQHFLDGVLADGGVQRALAERVELVKRLGEGGVVGQGPGDDVLERLGQVGDALVEDRDGLVELLDLLVGVAEEAGEQGGQFGRLPEVGLQDALLVLVQDGAAGVLEDGVDEGVAAFDLGLDLGVQVVLGVLGLPVAARDAEIVLQGGVGPLAAGVQGLFEEQGPAGGLGVGVQELGEGESGGLLLGGVVGGVAGEVGVVGVEVAGFSAGEMGVTGALYQEPPELASQLTSPSGRGWEDGLSYPEAVCLPFGGEPHVLNVAVWHD